MKHNTLRILQALLATVLIACGLNAAATHVSPLLQDNPIGISKSQPTAPNCFAR